MLKRLLPLLLILCLLPLGAWAAIEEGIPVASREEIPPVTEEEEAWAREVIAFWFDDPAVLNDDYRAEYESFNYANARDQLYYSTSGIWLFSEQKNYYALQHDAGKSIILCDVSVRSSTEDPSIDEMGEAIHQIFSRVLKLPAVQALVDGDTKNFTNRKWVAYPEIHLWSDLTPIVSSYVYQWTPKDALHAEGYTLPEGTIVSFHFATDTQGLQRIEINLP